MKTIQLIKEINKLQKLYDKTMKIYYKSLKYDETDESTFRFPISSDYKSYDKAEKISKLKYKLIDAKKAIDEYNETIFNTINK
jgi:hypothetical protein